MKYYKIKLLHTNSGYQYPSGYNDLIGVFNQAHVYYQDEIDDIFTLLIAVLDVNALITFPVNVTEITEAEALIIAQKYDSSKEIITNQAVVQRLAIKASLGQIFTQKELDAIDPTKGELGFGMSENFEKIIEKKKLK